MSSPAGAPNGGRRDDARTKAAQLQAQAAAAERRRRSIFVAIAVAVVAVLAIGVTIVVRNHNATSGQADAAFGDNGAIAVPAPAGSKPAAANAVTVRTAFDYMCPICNSFESQTDAWQQEQVKAGKIKREFIPVSILDNSSNGTKYSTRSASAGYAVATADPAKIHDFTQAMYKSQPEENSNGLTNDQILAIAKKYVPNNSTMDNDIKAARYSKYVTNVTEQASKDGLQGTPTIWVNGKQMQLKQGSMLDQLKQAVKDASSKS